MRFNNGIAEGIAYEQAKNVGGIIVPEVVVLHDTAGRLDKFSSANYLLTAPRGVSVHFVIERDATITQQVPINRRAGHAGRSHYHGRDHVNAFSVGIEIVNPGRMTYAGDGYAMTWFKQRLSMSEYDIREVSTPEHGHGFWMDYTAGQITACESLLHGLFAEKETLKDIVTHWYVSPGRKVDTNPLFPLEQLKARVLGRDDAIAQEADDDAVPEPADAFVEVRTQGSGLNMRRWPSFNPNILLSIPNGTHLPVIRKGIFADRWWSKVAYGGQEGWIVSNYTSPIIKH